MAKNNQKGSIGWITVGTLAGAILAVTIPIYLRYKRDLGQAVKRVHSGSQVIPTACGPIEYTILGEGPDTLVVHGATGGYDQSIFITQAMGAELRCVAMSRFGYLRTPLPANASPAEQASAHVALLDALGIPQAFIIGLSAGGPSALEFALRYPERCQGLVLISAISRAMPIRLNLVANLVRAGILTDLIYWLSLSNQRSPMSELRGIPPGLQERLTPAEKDWVQQFSLTSLPISQRRIGIFNDLDWISRLQTMPLENLTVPTLVVHARDDPLVPFEHGQYAASRIPGAQFLQLTEGGHLLIGQHDQVKVHLSDFIRHQLKV